MVMVWGRLLDWKHKWLLGRLKSPKKSEIDQTIGIPKRLTKSTWTPLKTINEEKGILIFSKN